MLSHTHTHAHTHAHTHTHTHTQTHTHTHTDTDTDTHTHCVVLSHLAQQLLRKLVVRHPESLLDQLDHIVDTVMRTLDPNKAVRAKCAKVR